VNTTNSQSLGEEPQDVFVEDNHSDTDVDTSVEQQPVLEENGDVPLLLTNEQTPEPELVDLNITTDDLEKNEQLQNDLEEDTSLEKTSNSYGLEEVDDFETKVETQQPLQLKEKGELYYEMYGDAKRRAKMLKDMALSAYLEAKEIKQKYNLDDSDEDSSDEDSNESDEEYEILEKL
jgi:hypothetical protein